MPSMAARPVQISLDTDLLRRIDDDPEVHARGRSAFIRSAVTSYLAAKEKREIEASLVKAYSGRADEMYQEIADLIEIQAWPTD